MRLPRLPCAVYSCSVTTGYVYLSDDDRQRDLASERGWFSDAVPTRPPVAERQVALVSFAGDAVDALALMARGARAVSLKWRVTLDNFLELDSPLEFTELIGRLRSPNVGNAVEAARARGGGQLDAAAYAAVRQAIADLHPEITQHLMDLESRAAARRPTTARGSQEPIVAYEYDAVGLSLSLAGIDRRPVLESWTGSDQVPFLEGLHEFRVPEDRMVEHDVRVFGNWRLLRSGALGMAQFTDGVRQLTVMNVNRAGVEHALGVDLVYYHHDYNSYVVVQYKRMTPRANGSGHEFRPNGQLRVELERMRKFVGARQPAPASVDTFRLDDRFAYLKLCPSTAREAFSHELIHGMYLPIDYWDVLMASPRVLGPHGGLCVNYDNVGRYLNNTSFIALVSSAWIGSRGVPTARITNIIRASIATRSLVLAEARGKRVRGASRTSSAQLAMSIDLP
jgi:hypothetical protein